MGSRNETPKCWGQEDAMPAKQKVDREEFRRLSAEEGWTIPELAEHFRIHPISVSRIRRDLGIGHKRNVLTPERRARIETMLNDGWSFMEIHRTEGADRDMLLREFPGRAWTREQTLEYSRAMRQAKPGLSKHWALRRTA
jgi:hypothetical protein